MRRTIILTATVACLSIGFSGAVFAQDRGSDRDTSRMDRMDRGGMDRGGMDRGGMDRDGMDRFHRDHGSYSDGDGRGRYADRRDDDGSDEHDRMVRMHERMMERMGSMGGGGGMGGGGMGSMAGGMGGGRDGEHAGWLRRPQAEPRLRLPLRRHADRRPVRRRRDDEILRRRHDHPDGPRQGGIDARRRSRNKQPGSQHGSVTAGPSSSSPAEN